MTPAPDTPTGARSAGIGMAPGASADLQDASVGQLFGRLSEDFSTLIRQEVALAKAEIKEEATKAGKGAGLLGGTGLAALFALLMASFAAAWGLAEVMAPGWAFLIMAAIYAAAAGVLFVRGRQELRTVHPVPEKTVESLKEDAQWAKHPTS
jgi:hypothetical protein